MIPRADFAVQIDDTKTQPTSEVFEALPLRDLEDSSVVLALLRKPDFQRETNHWSPDQIVTLIESYIDDQLIPALILWKSSKYVFVIDGGHRLSALRAWIKNDYGDGVISQNFYGGDIPDHQKRIAQRTRNLVDKRIGPYASLKEMVGSATASSKNVDRALHLVTRALFVQWVRGNEDVAEQSFFNINRQGTPLTELESMLIKNRNKALAIASRAVVRAGTGHKYWSRYDEPRQHQIEQQSSDFYSLLFEPEVETPVRTLDLPLGGSSSPIEALALLIDFFSIASAPNSSQRNVYNEKDDPDGSETAKVFSLAKDVLRRIEGTDAASLGLHPALYFYNERGVYSRHQFLGTVSLIAEKVRSGEIQFFRHFTSARKRLEHFLLQNKPTISLAFTNLNRNTRVTKFRDLLEVLVNNFQNGDTDYTVEDALTAVQLGGKILAVSDDPPTEFSKLTKVAVFVKESLSNAQPCPICGGLLYPKKSVHFDHITRVSEDGKGTVDNGRMTHPYCNSVVRN